MQVVLNKQIEPDLDLVEPNANGHDWSRCLRLQFI
jgi:hypothetical protein